MKIQFARNLAIILFSCLLIILVFCFIIMRASAISTKGQQLSNMINQMDVEHHWLPGTGIEWKNGTVDPNEPAIKSHCSTFVAAISNKNNIYILRPPDHPQKLLANAQFDWLREHGAEFGWITVTNPAEAQNLANKGLLVIVTFKNPSPDKPGHIAVVRPSDKSRQLIHIEGPQIVQAGLENYNSVSLKTGFRHHSGAWISDTDYGVKFYAHEI